MKTVLDQLTDPVARALAGRADGGLLVAASGGVDSTALALLLARLAATDRLSGPLTLGHVDHGVQSHSRSAAIQVAELARRLGIRSQERRLSLGPGPHSEQTLRDARYAALEQMATDLGVQTLVTAHHADDQLETVLFRALRGAGPAGLAGIPVSRPLGPGLTVMRPLLEVPRGQLEDLIAESGEPVVEDPSNRNLRFTRNRLRHEVLPRLRHRHGTRIIDDTLRQLADAAREVATRLEQAAVRLLRDRAQAVAPWRLELRISAGQEPRPFLAEAVRRLLSRVAQTEPPWTAVERATDLIAHSAGSRLHGPGQPLVERTRTGLLFVDLERAGQPPSSSQLLEPGGGAQRFGTTEWVVTAHSATAPPAAVTSDRGQASLDPDRAPLPWRIRRRRAGDRFWPLGMPGPVDLRGFTLSRHLPRYDRERVPLVVDARDQVIWVPGVEISHHARLLTTSERCVELTGGVAAAARSY